VFGVAQTKGNMRAIHLRGMKYPIVTESNRSVKSWQQLVAEGASRAMGELPSSERAIIEQGVRLTVAFYLPRPKKHHKRGVFVPHCVKPDLDRCLRAILDALTGVAYHDDNQVTELVTAKYYAGVDEPARVQVRVEPSSGVQAIRVPPAPLPLFEEAQP
jgi:crossover junction endodeoxyribonuclease RusA